MKKQIKKWTLRLVVLLTLAISLILVVFLNPKLTYANVTTHSQFRIYHQQPIDAAIYERLDNAYDLLKDSELFQSELSFDICLNDGAVYPTLMRMVRGRAFAWGFSNKVVLQGNADYQSNAVELNGYRWNLSQLLAHELTHCLQFNKFGFWKSKPISNIPDWKWEGYAEYVARRAIGQTNLAANIRLLHETDQDKWAITWSDDTIAPRNYFEHFLLVQYCIDVKKMSYAEVLGEEVIEDTVRREMMTWFNQED